MIILINLLYLIFYRVDTSDSSIVFEYPEAEVIVQIMGIIQAFISFIVLLAYFQKYHGVFWQQHLENAYIVKKSWFTNFKGSMGYAYGQQTVKLS